MYEQKQNRLFKINSNPGPRYSSSRDMFISTLSCRQLPDQQITRRQPHLNVDKLTNFISQALSKVYDDDSNGPPALIRQLLTQQLSNIKHKLQERISLLCYLQESLRYKTFAEVDVQMQKQWKKNCLFALICSLWCIATHKQKFNCVGDFIHHYDLFRSLVANITHFYFQNALTVLQANNKDIFVNILDDTAHHIINSAKEWKQVYLNVYLPLLRPKGNKQQGPNFELDLRTLQINPQLLQVQQVQNRLSETTKSIADFADSSKIVDKIQSLKKMRKAFLREIDENRARIATKNNRNQLSTMEKDDIIGCMIYCVIKGQITNLAQSLDALMHLIGRNSSLLSKKGVDSFRADLQSAIIYLKENQLESPLITVPKNILQSPEKTKMFATMDSFPSLNSSPSVNSASPVAQYAGQTQLFSLKVVPFSP